MPSNRVFISHSRRDVESIQILGEIADQHHIELVLMEYEGHSRGNQASCQWIKSGIQSSDALILILSRNAVGLEQTRNWIIFEIGIAFGLNPAMQVTVIKEDEVSFPVPYLSVYYPLPLLRAYASIRGDTPTVTEFLRRITAHPLLDSVPR